MVDSNVTLLLSEWRTGSPVAAEELAQVVYQELRVLARAYLSRERNAGTLQPTALVNEAWLKLTGQAQPDWQDRAHFFGVAARCMRQILVDHARQHRSHKRGGGLVRETLVEGLQFVPEKSAGVVELSDALDALEKVAPRKVRVIELRFFAGFSMEETAEALGISVATVGREQRMAEAWLYQELNATRARQS